MSFMLNMQGVELVRTLRHDCSNWATRVFISVTSKALDGRLSARSYLQDRFCQEQNSIQGVEGLDGLQGSSSPETG